MTKPKRKDSARVRSIGQFTNSKELLMDRFMEKMETKFDGWLEAFSEKPISTSIKIILAFFILRWMWRSFK